MKEKHTIAHLVVVRLLRVVEAACITIDAVAMRQEVPADWGCMRRTQSRNDGAAHEQSQPKSSPAPGPRQTHIPDRRNETRIDRVRGGERACTIARPQTKESAGAVGGTVADN